MSMHGEQLTLEFEPTDFLFSVGFVGAVYNVLLDCGWSVVDACKVTVPFHLNMASQFDVEKELQKYERV